MPPALRRHRQAVVVGRFTENFVIDPTIHTVTATDLRTGLSQSWHEVYLSRATYLDLNVSNKPAA